MALAALELNKSLPEAHTSLAIANLFYYWNTDAAEEQLLKALDLNPNCQSAQYWYTVYLTAVQRSEKSIAESIKGERSDPSSSLMSTAVARVLYYDRQYDRAIEQCQKTLNRFPDAHAARYILASCLEQKRSYEEAIQQFQQCRKESNDSPVSLAMLGTAYASAGNTKAAMDILEKLDGLSSSKSIYISPVYIATIWAALGNVDKAFELLETACERDHRASEMIFLRIEPTLSKLQKDPRFPALVARVRPLEP